MIQRYISRPQGYPLKKPGVVKSGSRLKSLPVYDSREPFFTSKDYLWTKHLDELPNTERDNTRGTIYD